VELLPVFPDKDLQPSQQVSLARTFQKGQLISLEGILRYCESEEDAHGLAVKHRDRYSFVFSLESFSSGGLHILARGFVGECFVQGQPFELVDLGLIQGADAQVPDNDVEDSNRVRSPER
jgi:hypothetical protein